MKKKAKNKKIVTAGAAELAEMMDYYNSLPPERLSLRAFQSLPEYSISTPTGTAVGKVWKRDLNFYRQFGPGAIWIICEYLDHAIDPNLVTIDFRRPVTRE
jgi:hypothetical protein